MLLNLYEQHKNAHISAHQYPKAYKERWIISQPKTKHIQMLIQILIYLISYLNEYLK